MCYEWEPASDLRATCPCRRPANVLLVAIHGVWTLYRNVIELLESVLVSFEEASDSVYLVKFIPKPVDLPAHGESQTRGRWCKQARTFLLWPSAGGYLRYIVRMCGRGFRGVSEVIRSPRQLIGHLRWAAKSVPDLCYSNPWDNKKHLSLATYCIRVKCSKIYFITIWIAVKYARHTGSKWLPMKVCRTFALLTLLLYDKK